MLGSLVASLNMTLVAPALPTIVAELGGIADYSWVPISAMLASTIVTPVAGKGPLVAGTDYTLSYTGPPGCRLDMAMLTAKGAIAPTERLIVHYRTRLDANTQNGIALTNVAGAIQWFNDGSGNPNRVSFTRTLTDGTPGIADFQDAHTVTTALTGFIFEKTVAATSPQLVTVVAPDSPPAPSPTAATSSG